MADQAGNILLGDGNKGFFQADLLVLHGNDDAPLGGDGARKLSASVGFAAQVNSEATSAPAFCLIYLLNKGERSQRPRQVSSARSRPW